MEVLHRGTSANQLAAGGKEPDISSHWCFVAAHPQATLGVAPPEHPSSSLSYRKPITGQSSQNSCPDTAPADAFTL